MKKSNSGKFKFIVRSDDGQTLDTDIEGQSNDIFEGLYYVAENDKGTRLTLLLVACEILRDMGATKAENAVFSAVQKETTKMLVN